MDLLTQTPRIVLVCHTHEAIDLEGLATWLANSMQLVGIVAIRDSPQRRWRALRREGRRSGWMGLIDVLAFRLFYAVARARQDAAWEAAEIKRLKALYPSDLTAIPRIEVSDPNTEAVRHFLEEVEPDLMLARCKVLLKPEIFRAPRGGTFVLHPGICPEYRNAHGCFWALAHRDLQRVGMTLLRIDQGVDTGPAYLQAAYPFDELKESHIVIQQRVVLENLEAIRRMLMSVWQGHGVPLSTRGRSSAVWGQPRLSAYWRWKRAARRERARGGRKFESPKSEALNV